MKRAQSKIKVVSNYVDQLKNNFDELIALPNKMPESIASSKMFEENIDQSASIITGSSSSRDQKLMTSSSVSANSGGVHTKIKAISDLKANTKSHALGLNHANGICRWSRFSVLNEYMKGFRLGELSVLTGPTGSGKTTFLCEYALDLSLAGVSTLWCSLEVPIGRLISWMLMQYSKVNFLALQDDVAARKFDECYESMQRDLHNTRFFDQHGSLPVDELVQAVEFQHKSQNLQHVLIDNLQFMQGDSRISNFDKYMKQDLIFSELRHLASKLNIHVTLVVHPRKELEGTDLHVNSLYGGVKASQEADNIFIIQKVLKPWSDPPFVKFLQIHKNRSIGELVLGNTIRMDFDHRTKCHALKKVQHQSRSPNFQQNWNSNNKWSNFKQNMNSGNNGNDVF